ncbi:hypothetical protein GGI07_001992 [Coemansia sp. Benny D115]|nr:hypothetical protein GGI07_001992 [Coemansia sp. Benny D115]
MWKMPWSKGGSPPQLEIQRPEDFDSASSASNTIATDGARENAGEDYHQRHDDNDNDDRMDQDHSYNVLAAPVSPDSALERPHGWGGSSGITAYTPTSPLAVAAPPSPGGHRSFMAHQPSALAASAPSGNGLCSSNPGLGGINGSGLLRTKNSSSSLISRISCGISPPATPGGLSPGGMKRKDSFVSNSGRGALGSAVSSRPASFVSLPADGRLDFLTLLPYEIATVIVMYANFPAITTIAEVSKSWSRFANDNAVWRRLFLQQQEWRTPRALAAAGSTSMARRRQAQRDLRNRSKGNGTASAPMTPNLSGANTPRIGDDTTAIDGLIDGGEVRQILSAYTGSSLRPALALQHMVAPSPRLGPTKAGGNRDTSDLDGDLGFGGEQLVGANWKFLFQQRLELDRHWAKGIAEVRTITGHADSVYCVQYDHSKIVTGSRDRTIKVWDSDTLECRRTLSGHDASVLCLKYDRTTLVTGSSDSTVIIWDWETGRPMQRLISHSAGVLDVAFDRDNVVSCSKDCTIKVWRRSNGRLLRTLVGHRGPVNAVQLHGDRIVSASGDSLIKMWDLNTGELIRTFSGHTRGLACVQFDGSTIVSGSSDQLIKVWDAETGRCMQTLRGHKDLVRTLHFTGGRRAVSGSYDQTIKVWDIVTGECTLDLADVHTSWVFDVQFSTSRIVSTSQDQKIIVWDFSKGLCVGDID